MKQSDPTRHRDPVAQLLHHVQGHDRYMDDLWPPQKDRTYLHSIRDDMFGKVMLHNVRLGKGYLRTGGALAGFTPHGAILSPYTAFNSEKAKEDVWETVRIQQFAGLPSRRDALFLFESGADLQKASVKWWAGQPRRTLKAQITEGAALHKADSRLLDSTEDQWEENAQRYWRGLQTDDPIFEVIVQGVVCFPEWETFPLLAFGSER